MRRNSHRKRGGTSYGEKTNLLIDRFRRLDGEPWRGAEIERESKERISTGYFSALRKDKIKNPGDDALEVIAHVVGFPPKLWELEPEEWEREVEKTRLLAEKERQAAGIPGRGVHLVDDDPDDPGAERRYGETHEAGEVAVRLDRLFENLINPRTGEPYDAYTVAALSEGLLTEGEVGEMRAGNGEPVRWVKLVALSNAFDVSPDYWCASSPWVVSAQYDKIEGPVSAESMDMLLRYQKLSKKQKHVLTDLVAQLAQLSGDGSGD